MLDMPRPRPPHLQRGVSRHGKPYWFVQMKRGAPKIRIRGEYGSPEFEAAYQAAVTSAPTARCRRSMHPRGRLSGPGCSTGNPGDGKAKARQRGARASKS